MKLAALFCFLGCGLASAVTIEPDVHLTFDTADSTQKHDYERNPAMLTNTGAGTGYTLTGSDYMRAGDDCLKSTTGYSFKTSGIYIEISNSNTLTLSKSFTLTFAVKKETSNSLVTDRDIGGLRIGSEDNGAFIDLELDGGVGNARKLQLNAHDSNITLTETKAITAAPVQTSFTRITLVHTASAGGSAATFTLYNDSTLIGSWTYTLNSDVTSEALTLKIGAGYEGSAVNMAFYDEVGVYNTALTAKEIEEQLVGRASGNIMRTDAIPEPATATLSLLALAGLAARRRRR